MPTIEYFFSLLSPFTYLAGDRLERAAARHGARIEDRPMDILALFAEQGTPGVAKRHPARQAYRLQDLTRLSERWGLPLKPKPAHWPTDAAPASAVVIAVAERGGDAGALVRSFLRAVRAEETDIADPTVIAAALAAVGEDAGRLAPAIGAARATYEANTRAALDAGVFGSPFYIVGDEKFWGADRLDDLDWWLGR